MKSVFSRSAAALVLAGAAAAAATPAIASATGATATRTVLAGSQPVWAVPALAAGVPAGAAVREFQVNLPLRDAATAQALAGAVSDPHSASYGKYLTAAQFDARFAPTGAQVAAVESWLRSSGIHVVGVPANNRYVDAVGTVSAIDHAFSTTIETYRVGGLQLAANATPLSVPSALAPDVLAVTGLDDGAALTRPDHIVAGGASHVASGRTSVATPCSGYWGQNVVTMPAAYGVTSFPTYTCGYSAKQLEGAYGVAAAIAKGTTGAGVTVAITDAYASPTIVTDVNAFSTADGIPTLGATQLTQVLDKPFNDQNLCGGAAGWNMEETLDVEAVHAMAPGANIVYMGAKNCANDLGITVVNDIVAKKLASVVSDSWSDNGEAVPASQVTAEHAIWVQGAAEGIGFNFSSGDSGDLLAATGKAQPSLPGSDDYVTAVGGTTLAVTKANTYGFETGWGNTRAPVAYDSKGNPVGYGIAPPGVFYAGAGGGTSHVVAEPWYQQKVVPVNLSHEYGKVSRVVPDVAALADPYTGMTMYMTMGGAVTSFAIGGTSLASPLFAGIEALANQGRPSPIGFANPLLYSLVGTVAFHDVRPTLRPTAIAFTSANPASLCASSCVITEGTDSSLQTAAFYDNVTGLGTPNGANFLAKTK